MHAVVHSSFRQKENIARMTTQNMMRHQPNEPGEGYFLERLVLLNSVKENQTESS